MERATIDRETFVRPSARPPGLRLRRRFPDVDALAGQVRQDVEDTRAWAATRILSDGAQNRRALLSLAAQ